MKNYDLLSIANSDEIEFLFYHELEDYFNDVKRNLPDSFFKKFSNLPINVTREVKNVDNLIWFLNNFENLTTLLFCENTFTRKYFYFKLSDQNFYDNLPITIKDLTINSDLNINYDFIFKLINLNSFCAFGNKNFSDLVLRSFLNLKNLYIFTFHILTFTRRIFTIKRDGKEFEFEFNFVFKHNKLNLNQLAGILNLYSTTSYCQ